MKKVVKNIKYTSHFIRSYKKLSGTEKTLAKIREKTFRKNCFDPILKTHKLGGKLKDCWSFSLTPGLRVLFIFVDNDSVLFLDIGNHNIYK